MAIVSATDCSLICSAGGSLDGFQVLGDGSGSSLFSGKALPAESFYHYFAFPVEAGYGSHTLVVPAARRITIKLLVRPKKRSR